MLVKNCFNYVGSKDRIFPIIDENLDKNKRYFFDIFCGGAVVGINEVNNYHNIYLNDICWQLTETMKYFRDTDWDELIGAIDIYVQEYELSKENKEGYLTLRDYYNINHSQKENFNPPLFYAMLTHSFNYLIGINKSGGYNVPFGKNRSCFSSALRTKLENFHRVIHENKNKVTIGSEDFSDLIHRAEKIIPNSMFYLDPPYLASDSSYNRVCYAKWSAEKEKALYEALDFINVPKTMKLKMECAYI